MGRQAFVVEKLEPCAVFVIFTRKRKTLVRYLILLVRELSLPKNTMYLTYRTVVIDAVPYNYFVISQNSGNSVGRNWLLQLAPDRCCFSFIGSEQLRFEL